MSDICTVFIDDIIRMLELVRCWLSQLARIIELLLLLLELKSLLLLLLTILRSIVVLFAFFFTLSFFIVIRCALCSKHKKNKIKKQV